jgi:hypothetical protein
MSFFRHTIAEYTCTKHCGYHRSVIGANMSAFHLLAAAVAAIPLWVFSLHEEFPWYYFVSILAGELILVFMAGFLTSFLLMPLFTAGTTLCKNCRSPMFFAGQHFDPAGSDRPHWSDIVIVVFFIGLNVAVWIALARGNL